MSNIVKGITLLKDKSGTNDILMSPSGAMNTVDGVELMRSYGVAKGSTKIYNSKYSELGNKNHTICFVAKIDIKYIDSFFDSIFSYGSEYAHGHYDVRVSGGFVMDYVPDNSLPEEHRADFGEPIIALKQMTLGNGQSNTFPAGYLLHGAGSGRNGELQRIEDPNNPRDKPYTTENQNTGTWAWKEVATTRGVEWQYAKEAQVDGDVETGDGVIGLSTNYDLSVYTLEIDRELMLLSLYKNGAPLKQHIPFEDRIEANEKINLFTNVAGDSIMHSQFGEMVVLPKINQEERQATEYYLLNKWKIGALVDLNKPAYGYQGSGSGVWEGSRVYPSILKEGGTSIFMKDQGMIVGYDDTAGEYVQTNALTEASMIDRIEASSSFFGSKTGGRWLYRHKHEARNGWFWESRQAGDMIYLFLGYVFWSFQGNVGDSFYKGVYTTITSTQRPFLTSDTELPQWVLDGYFETTSDGQVFLDDAIYKIEKSIDWLQNNHNNRITIEIDSVITEYVWRQEGFDLIFTDVYGTHQRRTYNGNLCTISQKYEIYGQPHGLDVDGIRGFYNTQTDKIEAFVRGDSGGMSAAIISVVLNDDHPSNVIAVCDDIIDPSDVLAGWSPEAPDQVVMTRLTPQQPAPVTAQNMIPLLVTDITLNIVPNPPIDVVISDVVIESTADISLTMIRVPLGQDVIGDNTYSQSKTRLYLGKYEVTEKLWYDVLGGALPDSDKEDHPVRYKTWDEVNTFLDALNERERNAGNLPSNWSYELPTKTEWEYACRAGTDGNYNWDGDWSTDKANFRPTTTNYGAVYRNATVSVTSFSPNAWGFHNMHGNVGEWTINTYVEWNYATDSWGNRKYIMGGGYTDYPVNITSSSYRLLNAGDRNWDVGFRLKLRKYNVAPQPPLSPQNVSTEILVNTAYHVYYNDTAETSGYYYPVYLYDFGIGDYHTHVIDGITYYMPDVGGTHGASSPPSDLNPSPYQAFALYGQIYYYRENTGLYSSPTHNVDKFHYPAFLTQPNIMSDTAYLKMSGSGLTNQVFFQKVWFPKYELVTLSGSGQFGIYPYKVINGDAKSYIRFKLNHKLLVEFNGYTGTDTESITSYGKDGIYEDHWEVSDGEQWVDTYMGKLSKRYRFDSNDGNDHELLLNVISFDKIEFNYRFTRQVGTYATAELNPVATFEKVSDVETILDANSDGSYVRYNS